MSEVLLPEGYTARPPDLADAPAVAALIAACEVATTGGTKMSEEELVNDWRGIDLADEAIVVVASGGRIVASADVLNRSYLHVSVYGYVHPDERGRGLGRWLVDWGERWTRDRMERAPADARVVVQHYINGKNEAARRLLDGCGYAPVRGVYTMAIELSDPPSAPAWPEGLCVRALVLGQDERNAHEAHEDAFRDVWGRPRSTFERFTAITRQEDFDPTLWFLVEDGAELAGVCFSKLIAGRGWIDVVGVRRPWRRRGLGLAMLRHAFGELYRRGAREIGLSVDAESITGAPRLYTRAGMHMDQQFIIYRKELRPGADYSERSG
jgi:mycothiol synthase